MVPASRVPPAFQLHSFAGVPTPQQSSLGKLGEDLACRELTRRGYVILARRYRTRHGEIDIVAREGEVLVFVEVKASSHDRFGGHLKRSLLPSSAGSR